MNNLPFSREGKTSIIADPVYKGISDGIWQMIDTGCLLSRPKQKEGARGEGESQSED
jgi:hypothetical protein